jgi:hypothetical protein
MPLGFFVATAERHCYPAASDFGNSINHDAGTAMRAFRPTSMDSQS